MSNLSYKENVPRNLSNVHWISILLPTYNTNPVYLRSCIDSVLSQSYDNWELCISDDNSTSDQTKSVINEYVEKYNNIKATFRKENGHISKSSNTATQIYWICIICRQQNTNQWTLLKFLGTFSL